jgi:uncharacterized delta-60 repeat protein
MDTSFGFLGDGTTTATGFNNGSYQANAVALQSDGKIVIAGMGEKFPIVARVESSGLIDFAFGNFAGINITAFGDASGRAFSVAIQGDDKIVFAGQIGFSSRNVGIGRLNSNGSIDTAFDGDGRAETDLGSTSDQATGMVLQPDGRIVVSAIGGTGNTWSLLRYHADGSLDTTFDGDGRVQLAGGSANAIALQPDGKIISAGSGNNSSFQLARHHAVGAIDSAFGVNGIATGMFLGPGNDAARHIALQQPDGKLVVVGSAQRLSGGQSDFALVRYLVNGSPDPAFGLPSFAPT